jgi:hypothetical protein
MSEVLLLRIEANPLSDVPSILRNGRRVAGCVPISSI